MHTIINGTEIRENHRGMVLTRGKRELHILGTSVSQVERARKLAAMQSFNRLFTSAPSSPIRNTRAIKLSA